jgi:hypothetical protein
MAKAEPTYPLRVFVDDGEEYNPRQLLDSLVDAKDALNYSNYDNRMYDMCRRLILLHCRAHGIRIGPNRATVRRRQHEAFMQDTREYEAAQGNPDLMLAYLRKRMPGL